MLPLDTTALARQQQIDIILSKTPRERAMMGVDMIDTTYRLVKETIAQKNPGISDGELVAKVFQRYYKRDFLPQTLDEIAHEIEAAHHALICNGV